MAIKDQFIIPKRYNTLSLGLMAVGILSIIILLFTHGLSDDSHNQARFWASLLQNSVYFLLVVNAAMFFIAATTLAWGGWQMTFRRVPEAISACVPVIGAITLLILMIIVFGGDHVIYHWTDAEHVLQDEVLNAKKGFLNKGFYTVWSIITIVGWSLLGWKIRQRSRSID